MVCRLKMSMGTVEVVRWVVRGAVYSSTGASKQVCKVGGGEGNRNCMPPYISSLAEIVDLYLSFLFIYYPII